MKIRLSFGKIRVTDEVLGLLGDSKSLLQNQLIDSALRKNLSGVYEAFRKKSYTQKIEILQIEPNALIICPLPSEPGLDRIEQFRLSARLVYQSAIERSLRKIILPVQHLSDEEFIGVLEGLSLSAYSFTKYKTDKKNEKKLEIHLIGPENKSENWRKSLIQTEILMQCSSLCRDLVNETGESLNPATYANLVVKTARKNNLKVKIRTQKELKREGFNGLLTVGKGSSISSRMVTLSYKGNAKSASPHLVLLGKGVTFDTGGISLKPGADMWEMKCDMAGSATAFAALLAIVKLKLKVNVSAILVLAENRPGYSAVLPGDIFKAKNGKTVMVENTDAEGRLILIDGLVEAGAIKASHIVDLATLTGAIVRALGHSMAGLFSNEEGFADLVQSAGKSVSEKLWKMPLEDEYKSQLDDTVADLKNIGKSEGGAISAALFLREFVPKKTKWAHIDIAGTAFINSPWKYYTPGATGWGVKTLVAAAKALAQ